MGERNADRRAPGISRRSLLVVPAAAALPVRTALAWRQTVTADLLAQGEAEVPAAGPVAWRVVQDVAEASPVDGFERRALGFAVNT